MSALDENDKKLLVESVKEGVREGISGSNKYDYQRQGSSPKGGGGDDGALFSTGVLGKLGKAVEGGADMFGTLKGQLDQSVDGFQQLSRTGLSFNNNAIGMRDSIAQTRLSLDEYKQVMEKLSPSLAGLGGTVAQGAANFNKFSSQFMQTDFADQLTKMGYTTKDLNDVMAANMANRRFTDLSDEMQRRKAIESTAELARQMDETAKLTGISRQEQMADMKQRTENGKVQAAIQLEIMKGGKDAEQNYRNMQNGLNGMGKGVKDLADELYTGGVRTAEGRAKMAALGESGIELEKAVQASKRATTEDEKKAAAAQLERAKAAVNAEMKKESYLTAVTTAEGPTAAAMQKMYEENKLKDGTTFTENKTGQDTGAAMAANKGAAVNQQQGRDEKGAKDEGSKTTELYIQTLNRSKDVTAMVASGANKMNDALVKIPETAKIIDNALAATRSRVKDENGKEVQFTQGGVKGILDRTNTLFGGEAGGKKGEKQVGGKSQEGPMDKKENPLDTIRGALDAKITNWAGNTVGGVEIVKMLGGTDWKSVTGGSKVESNAEGSKASYGDWFGKDWGAGKLSMLHGKEAVVPEAKAGEFIKDMMEKANISNLTPKDVSANKTSMTMEEMDEMMKSMKAMKPEALLEFATKGNEQQAEMAKKIYGEMDLAAQKAKGEEKLKKPETATATPKDNPVTELQKKLVEAGAKIKVDGKMGPETMAAIKANAANMVRESAKKPEPAPATAPATDLSKSESKDSKSTGDATLSDVVKSLESLNMLMGQLTAHAAETAEHSGNAVKATKGLNGNLFAR